MNCAPGICADSYSLLSPTCSSTSELSFRCFDSQSVDTIIELFTLLVAGWAAVNDAKASNAKTAITTLECCLNSFLQSANHERHSYSIAVSSRDRPSANRLTLNCEASIRSECPLRIKSAVTRPEAGECMTPWPLKPFTKNNPSTSGAGPIIAW